MSSLPENTAKRQPPFRGPSVRSCHLAGFQFTLVSVEEQPLSRDELRLLYQVTVSDLSYFKTQQ